MSEEERSPSRDSREAAPAGEANDAEAAGLQASDSEDNALSKRARRRLQAAEADLDVLAEAMADKEAVLEAKDAELGQLRASEYENDKALQALKVQLRRATQAAGKRAAVATTSDACLSAREMKEGELVALRDDALVVKEKQIALINSSNEKLRANVDGMEEEMGRMQADLQQRDEHISALVSGKEQALDRVAALEKEVQVKLGKEAAMEVATKQNSQLLQLLQQQESLAQDLEARKSELEDELQASTTKQRALLLSSSEHEVAAAAADAQASRLKRELMTIRSSWSAEEKSLKKRLAKLQTESSKTIAAQGEELRMRREKHYEMLGRMQEAEDKVRGAEDKADRAESKLLGSADQIREAATRLIEVQRWADVKEREHTEELARAEQAHQETQAKVKRLERERSALTLQLQEMSGTVIKAIGKQQGAIEDATRIEHELSEKQAQLQDVRRRMASEGNLQGKRRMRLELEQRTLSSQLDMLRKENTQLARATNANFDEQTAQVERLIERCSRLHGELDDAHIASDARLDHILRFVDASGFTKGPTGNNGSNDDAQWTMCFEGAHLGASRGVDAAQAAETVRRVCRHLASAIRHAEAPQGATLAINLANNGFVDDHVDHADGLGLASVVQASCKAGASVSLDLSRNHVSAAGIRCLVLALNKNPGVQNVFVHRDGSIQGLKGTSVVYTVRVDGNAEEEAPRPQSTSTNAPKSLPALR